VNDNGDEMPERLDITREALADGSLLALVRAVMPPGTVRSDAEIATSLNHALTSHDPATDLWVFGYGSLMWNPAFFFAERQVGTVHGWHRRFCLWIDRGRARPDRPGLMLALDRGGMCRGIAFRIPAANVRSELLVVWRREMFGNAYLARWVRVHLAGVAVSAITFVVNRSSPRYAGKLSDDEATARISGAVGPLGSCRSYLENTISHLHELGIRDGGLQRIAERLLQ
jgi:cation transport protein ChaC